jgi:hypothetical protein
VTLTPGQAVPANFVLQGVTAYLRGQLRDGNGTPIPNIRIVVQPVPFVSSGAGSIYPSTDGSGNFDVGVRAGVWDIQVSCVDAQERGYVVLGNFQFTVVDGVDQNGLVITSPVSTAVITGTVKNSLNQGIEGVTLDANQNISGNQHYYPGCISTDINGNYTIKVLGGTWQVAVRNHELTARGYSGVGQQSPTISGGTATANFVALPLPATINTLSFGASQAQFNVSTPAPTTYGYTVQYSTNLKANAWTTLLTTNSPSGSFNFVDPLASNTFRFYRITSP